MSDGSRHDKLATLTAITREMEPDADGAGIRAHFKALESIDPDVLITGAEDRLFTDFALTDFLPKIQCPALLIQGNPALGGVMDDKDAQRALKLLPKATHVYVPDMGHNLHVPQPHRFFAMVSNFIESLD